MALDTVNPPPPARAPGRPYPRARRPTGRPRWWPVVAAGVLVLVLVVVVPPVRTFLAQRSATVAAEGRLATLTRENDELEERAARLRSDAGVERMAGEQFGLVRPGEKIEVAPPVPTTTAPPGPSEPPPPDEDRNIVQRALDALVGLF